MSTEPFPPDLWRTSTIPAQRLAWWVKHRREDELDLTQLDVAAKGGPSNSTLTKIEGGNMTSLSRKTARTLDAGLDWQPGSARRLYNGEGEPLPLEQAGTPTAPRQPSTYDRIWQMVTDADDMAPDEKARVLRALEGGSAEGGVSA